MTREEAITAASETVGSIETVSLVMDIYDNFESRTCNTCVHSDVTRYDNNLLECWLDDIGNVFESNEFGPSTLFCTKDFGCNKWEKKDD